MSVTRKRIYNKKSHRVMTLLSRRGDSNTRPLRPERSALPTALLLDFARKISIIYWRKFSRSYESGCKGTAFF